MASDVRTNPRVAVVTGASSGIGRACALALAEEGAAIVLTGRDRARLEDATEQIRSRGHQARWVQADLVADDLGTIVDSALAWSGQIDVLVHSAGLFSPQSFGDSSAAGCEVLDRLWNINARAPFRLTELVMPHLANPSSVIFISAAIARTGFAGGSGYAMSKGAIEALTRSLAVELAPHGIRVNAVSPGLVATPMSEVARQDPEFAAQATLTLPGRFASAHEIAAAVRFLASDDASYLFGTVMDVQGGYPTLTAFELQ
jgi:NAD(P)-dependent dehydrogenase (short-subunit alcohol dehydrogenase family)